MNRLWLFKQLRLHRKLSEKRMIDLEKNKVAKWVFGFVEAMVVIYMLMFAVMFSLIANDSRSQSPMEFILMISPVIMLIDFFTRFMAQQTPSQVIKPYVLLPIPKYTCIDFFLTGQMINWSNLIWFIILVPFCIMSVLFGYGFWMCVSLLLYFWLLELCISQYYLIVRTLINDTLLWWLLPIATILLMLSPAIDWANISQLFSKVFGLFSWEDLFDTYATIGLAIEEWRWWPQLMLVVVLAVLFFINRKIQYAHVMTEVARVEKTTVVKNTNSMNFLNRFGELGLYLGLEIKTTMRNKNPRKSFIMGAAICVLFAALCAFSDVYDSNAMQNFWCLYCYCIFGATTLIKVMCNEGNFIDGLMVRKENILQILTAKYVFNCLFLIIPFVLMLIPVFSGKWSLLMLFSYGVFSAGFQFFLLFQLAVINKSSQPLNTKFISKNGMENNKWQIIIEMICLLVPVIVVTILQVVFNELVANLIMLIIGVSFIATHRLWLRNIYNRFMKRRYTNLEGFRATR